MVLFVAVKQARKLHRDPLVLMNQYYHFKTSNPLAAKKALLIILQQDPNYIPALQEYSQWMLAENSIQTALPLLERLHKNLPKDNNYAFQLAYAYYALGEWDKAHVLLMTLQGETTGVLKNKTNAALKAMASYLPLYTHYSINERFTVAPLWNEKPVQQWALVAPKKAFLLQPDSTQALKEAGYLAIAKGHPQDAIALFKRVYENTPKSEVAMQLAYLYEQLNNKPMAYQYFRAASYSSDKTLSLCAENSLTHLAGQQIKVLPRPFFSEIYFNPFSQSRFGLTVLPFIGRLGLEQANWLRTKEYVFLRRTQDNRSQNLGEISQIYEDNVQITGVGVQVSPLKKIPLIGFIETGAAHDLIYQERARWRADLRAGLMYYQDFGSPPAYFDRLKIGHDYYSDWYADGTYFSRYNNNVIGLVRTHQGIRLLQYQSSMLNLYMTGRVITDTRREFYNNIAEIGPGISFVPSNRFNVQLRFEQVNGVYLPAGASVNPYNKYYSNNLVQLLFYIKL